MCIHQEALEKFHQNYIASPGSKHLRFGQMFVLLYIKDPWPELFYETCEVRAATKIAKWLDDHCYFTDLPEPIHVL